jgi:HK97 family phage major capsid protein
MSTSLHTIDPNDITVELKRAWHELERLARRGSSEGERTGDGKASGETQAALDEVNDRITLLEAQLERAQTPAGSLTPRFEMSGELTLNGQTYQYAKQTPEHLRFVKALRVGLAGLPDAQRDSVKMADDEWMQAHKAMSLSNDTLGGYAASPEFSADILRALLETSPIRQVATVSVHGGTGLFIPVRTDVQAATRVSETGIRTADATQDLDFRASNVPVHESFCFTAVSRALLMDSKYDLAAELVNDARIAFAKLEGTESITGDGNGRFRGLNNTTLAAANIVTSTDSSGHSVFDTDLAKLLFETINAAYLPGAKLLMNKKTLGKFRQLKATSGNSLFFPVQDTPGTLAGFPVVLMPDMDEVGAASRNVVYLVAPNAYAVAQRFDVTVIRAPELYAEVGKTLFYIFVQSGGQAVLPEGISKIVTA